MKKKTEKLKPCPFCGGPAHIVEYSSDLVRIEANCDANCPLEGLAHGAYLLRQTAIENWNRRA